jgi:hypothetical protein
MASAHAVSVCDVTHGECRFGDIVLPTRASVGRWFETSRDAPFFRAAMSAVTPGR